jgi:hypothetical protein
MEDWENLCKLHAGKRPFGALQRIDAAILCDLKNLLLRAVSRGELEICRNSEDKQRVSGTTESKTYPTARFVGCVLF